MSKSKKIIAAVVCGLLIVVGVYLLCDSVLGIAGKKDNGSNGGGASFGWKTSDSGDNESNNQIPQPERQLNPGEAFEENSYIDIADVRIIYNGKNFYVHNNRNGIIRINCSVVGVKKDGTYDTLQIADFGGEDKAQYEKDMRENGWAIEKHTNVVRPGETLVAALNAFDFSSVDNSYPENDIDNDGYLDIVFTIRPQENEDQVVVSSDDPVSSVYKIKI